MSTSEQLVFGWKWPPGKHQLPAEVWYQHIKNLHSKSSYYCSAFGPDGSQAGLDGSQAGPTLCTTEYHCQCSDTKAKETQRRTTNRDWNNISLAQRETWKRTPKQPSSKCWTQRHHNQKHVSSLHFIFSMFHCVLFCILKKKKDYPGNSHVVFCHIE